MDHAAHSSATAEPACHTRELDPSTRLDNAYPTTGATTRGTWTPRGHCSISSIFLGALNRRRTIAPPDMTTRNPHSHRWKHRVTWGPGLNFRRGDILNASLRWSRNNINLPGGSFITNRTSISVTYNFSPRLFAQALIQHNDRVEV